MGASNGGIINLKLLLMLIKKKGGIGSIIIPVHGQILRRYIRINLKVSNT